MLECKHPLLTALLMALLLASFITCQHSEKENIVDLYSDWSGKEIQFPSEPIFTINGRDTVNISIKHGYKVVMYVDSLECLKCRLIPDKWHDFIHTIDSLNIDSVQMLFFIIPKKDNIINYVLSSLHFSYPVCIDLQDSLNILNRFPADENFHTFLLDKDNKVLAIGNPVLNPKIKELYLNIIQGKDVVNKDVVPETTVSVNTSIQPLGSFNWKQIQRTTFVLKNIGKQPLRITDVITSCGCTTVEFPKEEIRVGERATLHVTYQADSPESVDTTIKVYANVAEAPVVLRITGEAKE
jgi:hypothetical protein